MLLELLRNIFRNYTILNFNIKTDFYFKDTYKKHIVYSILLEFKKNQVI